MTNETKKKGDEELTSEEKRLLGHDQSCVIVTIMCKDVPDHNDRSIDRSIDI